MYVTYSFVTCKPKIYIRVRRECSLMLPRLRQHQAGHNLDDQWWVVRALKARLKPDHRAEADFFRARIDAGRARLQRGQANVFIVAGDDSDFAANVQPVP